jgi:hypothetical protein
MTRRSPLLRSDAPARLPFPHDVAASLEPSMLTIQARSRTSKPWLMACIRFVFVHAAGLTAQAGGLGRSYSSRARAPRIAKARRARAMGPPRRSEWVRSVVRAPTVGGRAGTDLTAKQCRLPSERAAECPERDGSRASPPEHPRARSRSGRRQRSRSGRRQRSRSGRRQRSRSSHSRAPARAAASAAPGPSQRQRSSPPPLRTPALRRYGACGRCHGQASTPPPSTVAFVSSSSQAPRSAPACGSVQITR